MYLYICTHVNKYLETGVTNQLPIFLARHFPPGAVPSTWSTSAQQRRGHGHRVLRAGTAVFKWEK